MFGEAESESPRVPSPWDSLISTPSTGTTPASSRETSPPRDPQNHPNLPAIIPRLVPENDDGNVEYKLQLLNPSPARFARLVTQLKWRLLEGGGQAYYELGVADSGALVGLPRIQLEQSLETLEMMAGEIGASVIVVKEVEVPAYMANIAASETERERWKGSGRKKRGHKHETLNAEENGTDSSTAAPSSWSTTETETSTNTDQDDGADEEEDDLSTTVVLEKKPSDATSNGAPAVRIKHFDNAEDMDDPANAADAEDDEPRKAHYPAVTVDLEISTVFKPRPMRARMVHPPATGPNAAGGGKQKRMKKIKHIVATHPPVNASHEHHGHAHGHTHDHVKGHLHHASATSQGTKAQNRRAARDKRREDRRRALISLVEEATNATAGDGEAQKLEADPQTTHLVEDLANLHVSVTAEPVTSHPEVDTKETEDSFVHISTSETLSPTSESVADEVLNDDDDDDVFASPVTAKPPFPTFSHGVQKLAGDGTATPNGEEEDEVNDGDKAGNRLIVEALVVRKMSLDEGFLDFGGFAMI